MEAHHGDERVRVARTPHRPDDAQRRGAAAIIGRAMRRLAQAFALVVVPLLAVLPGAAPGAPATGSSARAYAIRIVVPTGVAGETKEVSAPPDAVQYGGAFAYPDDGSIVATGPVTASVTAATGAHAAVASASSEVGAISLFGGEVTIERVAGRAVANADSGNATVSTAGSAVSGLVVAGAPVEPPAGQVQLGDWGYADVLV